MRVFEKGIIGSWLADYKDNLFLKRLTSVLGVDILVKASGFLLIPIYLRLMSQDEYGMYNYLLTIIQTLALVMTLGLNIPLSKLYHSVETKKEKGSLLFSIAIILFLFIAFISLPVFIFGLDYKVVDILFKNSHFYAQYRAILLLALLVTVLGFMLTSFLFTSEKIKQIRTYNILRILYITITLWGLYTFRGDAVHTRLVFTYVAELILLCIFGYYFVKEMVARFRWNLTATCLKMGLPIMLSVLFGIIVNFSDKFFLEKYGSLKDLSSYYLAFSFANIIPIVFAPLQNVWLPLFMKEKDIQKNVEKTKELISKMVLFFLALSIAIWLLFEALLVLHTIPSKYSNVTFLLPLLIVTQILTAISSLLGNYLIYFEKTQLFTLSGLLASVAGIVLGSWLIPIWGVYGAGITALISNSVYLAVNYLLVQYCKRRYLAKPAGL